MTVVDAGVVVAALVDSGATGVWAEAIIGRGNLSAPTLLPYEVTNVLRRASASGDITHDVATLAFRNLSRLHIYLYDFEPLAVRIWELRENLAAYDAGYVALAERLDVELATIDRRLDRSPGPTCVFLLPPTG
jgi:predicted nucleic acid-binding protein